MPNSEKERAVASTLKREYFTPNLISAKGWMSLVQHNLPQYIEYLDRIFLGKKRTLRLTLACVLAGGHLLIEDVPGVGKTTLINLLARTLGLPKKRIQLTSDLLPADIIGNLIYNPKSAAFEIYKGPIFSNIVLADELNRATPRTQSAFLQAMEESFINIDDQVLSLPSPFIVFATQNPNQNIGTFALPESQLDRFLMKLKIGFPDAEAEKALLRGVKRKELIESAQIWFGVDDILALQDEVKQVHVSEAIVAYVEQILTISRNPAAHGPGASHFAIQGLSPRAGIALIDAAKAWAYLKEREMVLPEDIQAVCVEVLIHRLLPERELDYDAAAEVVARMIHSIDVF
jgi:MoxR-like ATPase